MRRVALALLAAVGCSGAAHEPATAPRVHKQPAAQPEAARLPIQLRFMQPLAGAPKVKGKPRAWQVIADRTRQRKLLAMADNEPARFAMALYAEAWRLVKKSGPPVLHIAVEKGGNYARRGFSLKDAAGKVRAFVGVPYLILGERPKTFRDTFLHETGHAIHALLIGTSGRPHGESVAAIPHSTAAVTDRRTAFNEGWAIHLETINAHCGRDPLTRRFYQRRRLRHGAVKRPRFGAEYYAAVKDMLSYAQTFARYQHVRDGLYVFEPAVSGDYLRVQLTPARDRRELRSPNALVASEGVVASVVFQLVAARGCTSQLAGLVPRYRPLFAALRRAENTHGPLDAVPLLDWIAALRAVAPEVGARAIAVFLDLTRGVTVDAGAHALWQRMYDTAIGLNLRGLKPLIKQIEARRAAWLAAALAAPATLAKRIGPVVAVQAPAVKVGLVLFGKKQPLSFDVNAAGPALLRLVPGIDAARARAIVTERRRAPFAGVADFAQRARRLGLPDGALLALKR